MRATTLLKKPFLLVYWFLKRIVYHIFPIWRKILRKRKKVYETHIEQLLNLQDSSPFNQISSPPWEMKVSGACLVLGKYVSSQIYHCARSNRWMEIFGFVLGKRFGDVFIGITFIEITNILRSSNSALPDYEHVLQLEREISSRYPDLEIVCTVHSHPSGVIIPSFQDKIAFMMDDHPNIIVSPNRLLFGSPIRRMAAFYHNAGKVRRIKLFEVNKEEVDLEDIDFRELEPSKEELLRSGELTAEINFGVFRVWMVFHPNITLKKLSAKLSELFGKKTGFIFLYHEDGWIYDPSMKVIDFFIKEGEHLVFPEFFKEVKQ